MRTVEQYLEKAVEFDALAATSSNECMQKRFTDIAACYRLLAQEPGTAASYWRDPAGIDRET